MTSWNLIWAQNLSLDMLHCTFSWAWAWKTEFSGKILWLPPSVCNFLISIMNSYEDWLNDSITIAELLNLVLLQLQRHHEHLYPENSSKLFLHWFTFDRDYYSRNSTDNSARLRACLQHSHVVLVFKTLENMSDGGSQETMIHFAWMNMHEQLFPPHSRLVCLLRGEFGSWATTAWCTKCWQTKFSRKELLRLRGERKQTRSWHYR